MDPEKKVESESQLDAVRELIAASNQGREVVPLIGAGFSIESGIPALTSLTQYLAKVEHYISCGLYNPKKFGQTQEDRERIRKDPSLYLRHFGWPDPNQLDADLWAASVSGSGETDRGALNRLIQEELVEDISRFDEELADALKTLRKARTRLASNSPERGLEDLKPAFGRLSSLKGNWKTLLAHLTHATPDYADTLFHQLVRHRQPGTSHRFLALLAPILGIRLFLTTNFDNLLEEALRLEGHLPMVYEVSRDSPLPHPSLIRQELSVVKLHGGAFGLRVGESLDYPLDEESRVRLRRYLPARPVLLVMGLGGWDRRITDLVDLVVNEARAREKTKGEKSGCDESVVYWMHFEETCPKPVQDLARLYPGAIKPARIQDPGALLLELYSRITGSHPPSLRPYTPHVLRPIDPEQPDAKKARDTDEGSIQFFLDDPDDYGLGSSRELARLVARKAATHTPIWVDLEAMHTITDVVVEIFGQLRKYDPDLLPIVLPVGLNPEDPAAFEKPIRRIYDALSRGHYLLAFSAVSSFGRPPTSHHSTPAFTVDPDYPIKEPARNRFLSALFRAAHQDTDWRKGQQAEPFPGGPLKSSILAFSVDIGRDKEPPAFYREVQSSTSKLVRTIDFSPEERVPEPADPGQELEALLLLSAFRRRRSIVALRSLLPRYPQALPAGTTMDERVDSFLAALADRGYLLQVEGGSYWMSRKVRDRVYASVQKRTRGKDLQKTLEAGELPELEVLERIALLATVHDQIADYYLSSLYAASRDLQALLEHLYHRASALRYLTKLDLCLRACARNQLPVPSRIGQRLDKIDLAADVPPDGERLTRLRQARLRALRRVVEREREKLLSGFAADTLVDWVDWIQGQDIPRFRADLCLDEDSRRKDPRKAVFSKVRENLPGGSPAAGRERQIAADARRLWDQLDNLKVSVLRDRLDVRACTDLRSAQIHRLLTTKAPDALPAPTSPTWLDERADAIVERTLADEVPIRVRRKVIKYLCDVWSCRRGLRDLSGMRAVERMVRAIVEPYLSRIEFDPDVCAMEIRRLRYTADGLLTINDRKVRGHSLAGYRRVEARAKEALKICERGLQVVEWSPGLDYFRQRSYFHSLRGRAATLLGDFKTAHRELDLARSGLVPRVGADREILAVSLLRLAECLLARADDVVTTACVKELRAKHPSWNDDETLSAEGRLCLLGDRTQDDWKEALGRCGSYEHRIELSGAMALWLAYAAGEERERDAWPRELYEQRKSASELTDQIAAWEQLWNQERINNAMAELREKPTWPQDLEDVQRISLAHWAPQCLSNIMWSGDLDVAIERAGRRLTRAEAALDQAELILAEARRNVEWWIVLYELRAKLRVQNLLVQSTEIRKAPLPQPPEVWEEKRAEERARFIAEIVNNVKAGLRAIRQGLDAVDTAVPLKPARAEEAGAPHQENRRVRRLIRHGVELMIAGGYLTREASPPTLDGKPAGDRDVHNRLRGDILLKRWAALCKAAGFSKIEEPFEAFQRFDEANVDLTNQYRGGPAGRAFILASIKGFLRSGGIDALLEKLA
jgi:hypothetical protein